MIKDTAKSLYDGRKIEEVIMFMIEFRNGLHKTQEKKKKKNKKVEDAIDNLEKDIREAIKSNAITLSVDFILESLTHLGDAPNLMYDDNGLWCITDTGMHPVVTGKEKIHGSIDVFCEKHYWENTIRKAIINYLNRE